MMHGMPSRKQRNRKKTKKLKIQPTFRDGYTDWTKRAETREMPLHTLTPIPTHPYFNFIL